MPGKKTLNDDLFYKGSSASLPRLHTYENKVPFWDFKEFARHICNKITTASGTEIFRIWWNQDSFYFRIFLADFHITKNINFWFYRKSDKVNFHDTLVRPLVLTLRPKLQSSYTLWSIETHFENHFSWEVSVDFGKKLLNQPQFFLTTIIVQTQDSCKCISFHT